MEEYFYSWLNYNMIFIWSVLFFIVVVVFVFVVINVKEVLVVWFREGEYFVNGNKVLIFNVGDKFVIICFNSDVLNGWMFFDIMFENVWWVGLVGYNFCDVLVDGKFLFKCKDFE